VGTRYIDLHTNLTVFPTSFWYRYRGRNFVGDGGWSSWVQGTIAALDGVTISANTINGDRIIANTLDANTIKTNTILTALLKTAAVGTRWELEGATGGANQMQFRTYETVLGVDKLRSLYNGGQLTMYNDSAIARMTLNKGGIALYRDNGNLRASLHGDGASWYNDSVTERVGIDVNGMYVRTDDQVSWMGIYKNTGWNGNDVYLRNASGYIGLGDTFKQILTDLTHDLILGNPAYGTLHLGLGSWGGTYVNNMYIHSIYGLNFFDQVTPSAATSNFFRIYKDGVIGIGTPGSWPDINMRRTTWFGNPMVEFSGQKAGGIQNAILGGDIVSYRYVDATQGIVWLGNSNARYLHWNGSQYVMPGASALVNGVTVGSGRASKKNIRNAKFDRAKFRTLHPKTFRFLDDADDAPERIGFVAEDVAEAIPGVAIDLGNDPHGKPLSGGKGYNLESLVAAQHAMIVELAEELDALRARVEAIRMR
jgi:hypothetical protein